MALLFREQTFNMARCSKFEVLILGLFFMGVMFTRLFKLAATSFLHCNMRSFLLVILTDGIFCISETDKTITMCETVQPIQGL